MSPFTCNDHCEMASSYLGWHAQADWFKQRRYKQRKCDECGLWKIVLAPDGERIVFSWWAESRGQHVLD